MPCEELLSDPDNIPVSLPVTLAPLLDPADPLNGARLEVGLPTMRDSWPHAAAGLESLARRFILGVSVVSDISRAHLWR